MKKIVIIDHEPLTVRRRQIFYIDELRCAEFEVEFWDCSQYFYSGMFIADSLESDYLRKFDSLDMLRHALLEEDVQNTVFIVEAFDVWKNRKFFRLLADQGCYMVKQEMYGNTTIGALSLFTRLMNTSLPTLLSVLWGRINGMRYRWYKLRYGIRYSLMISSGFGADIRINHPDWEQARDIANDAQRIIDGEYVVFLDEYFPLHPDLKYFIDAKLPEYSVYQRVMCSFFDAFEQRHGVRVVVAAHPKSEYGNEAFGGRQVIKYKTERLVRDASMVLMHGSASVSYAVIFDKPLALITTNDYEAFRDLNMYMMRIARMFELKIFNVERSAEVEVRHIDAEVRNRYIYDYLTGEGIEQTPNQEILCRIYA